jgi:hypothetical protein
MGLPHSTASFPHLAKVVTLPEPKNGSAGGGNSRGRRRRRH